jgi:hypothetical protein
MTSNHFKPETGTTVSLALRLLIADQEVKTTRPIPVLIRNLSTGGITLTVTNPLNITDWDRYRGEACVLQAEDPVSGEAVNVKAKIAWTRFGGTGQPPLSLGLELIKPPDGAIRRLSSLLPHTSKDIKGLWDRYDQIREKPGNSDLVHRCYIAGLVLLLGGLGLQFSGSPGYKVCGWGLWLLGSLGIAGYIIRPFWPNKSSIDQFGKTL